jgi:DNA-directed RNA polymerase subunit RPC12/RpoP
MMMKKKIALLFLFAFCSILQAQSQPVTYTCPMHPEIHATKPGNCPKCGMKLVKENPKPVKQPVIQKQKAAQISKDSTKPKAIELVTYTCPMHPEIHTTKPGNCPKCGMKLVKEKPKQSPLPKHDEMQGDTTLKKNDR